MTMHRMTPLEAIKASLHWAEHDGKQTVEIPIDTLRELLTSIDLAAQNEDQEPA